VSKDGYLGADIGFRGRVARLRGWRLRLGATILARPGHPSGGRSQRRAQRGRCLPRLYGGLG
jgi:hypothetical protein